MTERDDFKRAGETELLTKLYLKAIPRRIVFGGLNRPPVGGIFCLVIVASFLTFVAILLKVPGKIRLPLFWRVREIKPQSTLVFLDTSILR